jgi:hypothetical protein
MAQDYTVFMQLVDQTPTVLAQNDGEPQGGEYPTGLWDQGEIVTDRRTLTIPVGLAAGRYRLVAGLYLLGAPERLPVRGPSGPVPENWVVVGEVATR